MAMPSLERKKEAGERLIAWDLHSKSELVLTEGQTIVFSCVFSYSRQLADPELTSYYYQDPTDNQIPRGFRPAPLLGRSTAVDLPLATEGGKHH